MNLVALAEIGPDGPLRGGIDALGEARELALPPGAPDVVTFGAPGDEVEAWMAGGMRTRCTGPADASTVAAFLDKALPAAPLLAIAGAEGIGTAVVAMLAARRGLPCVSGARRVYRHGGRVAVRRPGLAGVLDTTVLLPAAGGCVSLLPGRRPSPPPGPGAAERVDAPLEGDPRVSVVSVTPPDPATMDLRDARVVVAGGQGAGEAGFRLLAELADRLGAALGGTRVAVDRGWLPHDRQIGSTGRVIAPEVYLAFGISGATQHTVGILGARHIAALDTNASAPLLGVAELGLVGDLFEVVPRVLAGLDPGRTRTDARRPAEDARPL